MRLYWRQVAITWSGPWAFDTELWIRSSNCSMLCYCRTNWMGPTRPIQSQLTFIHCNKYHNTSQTPINPFHKYTHNIARQKKTQVYSYYKPPSIKEWNNYAKIESITPCHWKITWFSITNLGSRQCYRSAISFFCTKKPFEMPFMVLVGRLLG